MAHERVDIDAVNALANSLREQLLTETTDDSATAEHRIRRLVDREAGVLDEATRAALCERIAERSFGLGPLEPLLTDADVEEVMVCGVAPVWVERGGRLEQTALRFADEAELRHAIERILAPLGRRVDEASPLVDARLPERTVRSRQSSCTRALPGGRSWVAWPAAYVKPPAAARACGAPGG